jgi:SAM-dependent methyltransferase
MASGRTDKRTIADFGEQWTRHRDNAGFYGSTDLFVDAFGMFVPLADVAGRRVGDIGSGTGRIVRMLLAAGAREVVAVEPSRAIEILREDTTADAPRIRYVHGTGEAIAGERDLDLVVSYGVLHHIVDPDPVVRAVLRALKPGGRFCAWIYGHEGNAAYLAFARPLRAITTRLPPRVLSAVSRALNLALDLYLPLCRRLPLPLAEYMNVVAANLDRDKRYLTIYDQLNPAYARYYRGPEARDLFERCGFEDVRLHHRHGYSWTVVGTKPEPPRSRATVARDPGPLC